MSIISTRPRGNNLIGSHFIVIIISLLYWTVLAAAQLLYIYCDVICIIPIKLMIDENCTYVKPMITFIAFIIVVILLMFLNTIRNVRTIKEKCRQCE
jgi:hypothetical protein